jgi:hypothetical protein
MKPQSALILTALRLQGVALCAYANVAVPSRAMRDGIRDYLKGTIC